VVPNFVIRAFVRALSTGVAFGIVDCAFRTSVTFSILGLRIGFRTLGTFSLLDIVEKPGFTELTALIVKIPVMGKIASDTGFSIIKRCCFWALAFLKFLVKNMSSLASWETLLLLNVINFKFRTSIAG